VRRRAFLVGSLLLAACQKAEERCKNCGMKIDPKSAWTAKLIAPDGTVVPFDTPRCAFTSWRSGKTQAKELHVQEYYDRAWRDAVEVRFVLGGDVLGPMGPDLVPVDGPRAAKFVQDHAADRALPVDQITMDVLGSIK